MGVENIWNRTGTKGKIGLLRGQNVTLIFRGGMKNI